MDARIAWQALQAQLKTARSLLDAGDLDGALRAVDAALILDGDFLAAQALRERILSKSSAAAGGVQATGREYESGLQKGAEPVVPEQGGGPAQPFAAERYEQFEERIKRRRLNRQLDTARLAIERGETAQAADVIKEIADLDPHAPDLPRLEASLDKLRQPSRAQRPSAQGASAERASAATARRAVWGIAAACIFGLLVLSYSQSHRTDAVPRSRDAVASRADSSTTSASDRVADESQRGALPAQTTAVAMPTSAAAVATSSSADIAASQSVDGPLVVSSAPPPLPSAAEMAATASDRARTSDRNEINERREAPTLDPKRPFNWLPMRAPDPPSSAASPTPAAAPTGAPTAAIPPPAPAPVTARVDDPRPPVERRTAAEPVNASVTPGGSVLSAPAVAPAVSVAEEQQVSQVLERYRSAYERLDARSARAVWPEVNEAALAHAFEGLQSQTLTFDACDVQVIGDAASATCRGSARYVPKVGSPSARVQAGVWTFTLRKSDAAWTIQSARVR